MGASGVCVACAEMYVEGLGINWRESEVGKFLTKSNRETAMIESGIAFAPTGSYLLENLAAPEPEDIQVTPAHSDLDAMIGALVMRHKWGYRRVHEFLLVGGVSVPSLATVKRRVRAMKKVA